MKKLDNKGFVLSETLVVSVFLMVLFTMIYTNFYPLIGEYEKRENYDDADGKYLAYWIKKIIESDAYIISLNPADYVESNNELVESSEKRIHSMNEYGYMRFNCSDVSVENGQRELCSTLVNAFEINGCDPNGNDCDIFITHYRIGSLASTELTSDFKRSVRNSKMVRYLENCTYENAPLDPTNEEEGATCKQDYFNTCCDKKGIAKKIYTDKKFVNYIINYENTDEYKNSLKGPPAPTKPEETKSEERKEFEKYKEIIDIDMNNLASRNNIKDKVTACINNATSRVFSSGTRDYILSLPNYTYSHTSTGAKYRVIIVRHHTKEKNNYYSYSTMEVIK